MSKIILLDVGGTLVDDDNNLPDSAVKAIRAALNSIWKQRPVRQREGFEKGELDAIREYSARKGEGLRFAAATMGMPLADTVAIGDSDNDLTMIEVAGIGIAMGNGEQCAKDAADWVADAVDASGLAHAFERLDVV
ncbi:HAD family hydrolase [Bifidobacterium bifidum]|uniref:HAD family hydrolase n=1 Tax=Bifidobacterium bifidum TaxID=1681 RepID=UPI003D061BDD